MVVAIGDVVLSILRPERCPCPQDYRKERPPCPKPRLMGTKTSWLNGVMYDQNLVLHQPGRMRTRTDRKILWMFHCRYRLFYFVVDDILRVLAKRVRASAMVDTRGDIMVEGRNILSEFRTSIFY